MRPCRCHSPAMQIATQRISADLSRRGFVAGATASLATLGLFRSAKAAPQTSSSAILFTNARVFDGISSNLRDGYLLVEGNRIKGVGTGTPATPEGGRAINCGGRVIMPGLIDMHWHAMFAGLSLPVLLQGDAMYIALAAAEDAERTLMRGFTTIRDLGGPSFALKQAIDQGLATGSRIYPSGAMITSSGGHGDMRPIYELPAATGGPFGSIRAAEGAMIADGAANVMVRVREQLLQGASHIKVVGSGGVSSPRSPLDSVTYTEDELRAAVNVCSDWDTYAAVHAYTPKAVQRAIVAGAKCVEHAHLMDDATAAMFAEKDVWLSTQPFLSAEDQLPQSPENAGKFAEVIAGTHTTYNLAKKHGIKVAFGSDLLFSSTLVQRQGIMVTHLATFYSNAELLKQVTAGNGQLLRLSGERNPYPGKLGVIEAGALADLLVVDGNPLEDIALVAKPEKSFVLIMKDGTIYKNALAALT